MEVDISNLRAQLSKQSSSSTARDEQISALQEKLERSEKAASSFQRELVDLKKNLERISQRAVKEGSERSSAETKLHSLERELEESKKSLDAAQSKCETLEQKISTLTTLCKESDIRSQARMKERDKLEEEVTELRKRLARLTEELQKTKDEKERSKNTVAQGGDDEDIDELEDEAHLRLQLRVRELEGELFELKRGVWKERRRELDGGGQGANQDAAASPTSRFDDIDLSGAQSPRGGTGAAGKGPSFTDVLTGGLSALTGGSLGGGLGVGVEEDDAGFDEEAFRRAQEEEARQRVERVKEAKRNLKQWEGWRLDLVEIRAGGGGGNGEIFDV